MTLRAVREDEDSYDRVGYYYDYSTKQATEFFRLPSRYYNLSMKYSKGLIKLGAGKLEKIKLCFGKNNAFFSRKRRPKNVLLQNNPPNRTCGTI